MAEKVIQWRDADGVLHPTREEAEAADNSREEVQGLVGVMLNASSNITEGTARTLAKAIVQVYRVRERGGV